MLITSMIGALVVVLGVVLAPAASATTPGTPGVPQAPTTLYTEDFENGSGLTDLPSYVSSSGASYTATPYWLNTAYCNGFVLSSQLAWPGTTYCSTGPNFNATATKAYALGLLNSTQNPTTNRALSTNTSDTTTQPPNQVMFATQGQLALPAASGRFVTFSVNAAATSCSAILNDDPRLRFYFRNAAGVETAISNTAINPCTDPRTQVTEVTFPPNGPEYPRYGIYAADSSILLAGSSVGIVMRNESSGNANGNDGAIDNIRVLDVTPQLDKSFSPTVIAPGGVSTLTLTVTNTSELAAKAGFSLTDTLPAGVTVATPSNVATSCPAGTATATATAVSLTGGSLNAGQASCTVTVSVTATTAGTYVNGPGNVTQVGLNPPGDTTLQVAVPSISVQKSATPTTVTAAGQAVTYSFLVTNTGQVPLIDVRPTETAFSGSGTTPVITCPAAAATLAAGASVTCTGTYTATQADADAGMVTNTATATGTPVGGGTPPTAPPSSAVVTITPAPAVTVTKSASPADTTALVVGQRITYTFVVANTGNVTLTNAHPTEIDFTGAGNLSPITPTGATITPGNNATFTATYTVLQADVDAGAISNRAGATGTPPGTTPPPDAPPVEVVVPGNPQPALSLTKTATPSSISNAGDQVTYSFLVTNTGNQTLRNVTPTETAFSGTGPAPTVTCPAAVSALAPAASVTCTATYTATQADVNSGSVTNTATATGTPPTGPGVTSPPSSATVTIPPAPALSIVKSATPNNPASLTLGQQITYSFVVTNTGNVTLSGVTVDDTAFSGAGDAPTVNCPTAPATLAGGQQITCTAIYTVQQDDVDAGTLTNTATATGTPPTGPPVSTPPSTVTVPGDPQPGLSVIKSASPAVITAAGQRITYSFTATNTGNTTLRDVTINEGTFSGTGTLSAAICPAQAASVLPGAQVICTAAYTATQADVDAGSVTNAATATGTPPSGPPVTSPPGRVVVPAKLSPGLSIVKSVDNQDKADYQVGEVLIYTFVATNTGNTTLTGVTVAEGEFSGSGALSPVVCPAVTTLAPSQQLTCTATYTVTQDDIDAGSVTNTATATATPPSGPPVATPPSTVSVPGNPISSLALQKTADRNSSGNVGDPITYTFTITNTGTTTQRDVAVDEGAFSGTGDLSEVSCTGDTTLLPGQLLVCTATYTLTQADVDAGQVTNSATANGTPPSGPPTVSPPATTTVPVPPTPSLSITKTANPATAHRAGEEVTYRFVVTNTGNVTQNNITVVDTSFTGTGALSAITCPVTTLAAAATTTCTATYTITQADVNTGQVTNIAQATGTPPDPDSPPTTSPPAPSTLPIPPAPAITVVKSADAAAQAGITAGQKVTYTFLVTNTGNVTLTDVAVADTDFSGTGVLSPISCPAEAAVVDPGTQVTCTATYTLTQADVDAGTVTNTATATGTPPGTVTPPVSPPSTTTVPLPTNPALTLAKSVSPTTLGKAGDQVTYSFLVTNTGNASLTDVTVVDTDFSGTGTLSAIDCPSTTLPVGKAQTCTATYLLTQADVDAGTVTNTATALGTPPANPGNPNPPAVNSPPSTATVTVPPNPGLTMTKTADAAQVSAIGQVVTYSFAVTNTGNVTLGTVRITDTDFSGSGELSAITCPANAASLAPGAAVICTATYTTTAADLKTGNLTNSATAAGTPPNGATQISTASKVTIPIVPSVINTGTISDSSSHNPGLIALGVLLIALAATATALLITRRRRAV